MNIYQIIDRIELEKIYPTISIKTYSNKKMNDCSSFTYERNDEIMTITSSMISKCKIISENEDTKLPIQNMDGSYNFIYNGTIYIDVDVKKYIEMHGQCDIIVGKYDKKSLSFHIQEHFGNVYSVFDYEDFKIIDGASIYYTNFLQSNYKEILHPMNQLVWVNNKYWTSTRKKQGELEKYIQLFSNEGFKTPLCLLNTKRGYYPMACNARALTAYYLNLPSIPTCIIDTNDKTFYNNLLCEVI